MRGTEQAEELAGSAARFFHVANVHYDRQMMHSLPTDNPGWSEAKGHQVQMNGLQDLAAAVRLLAVAIRQVYDKLNQPRR
jgi:hypothetical protein